MQKMILLSAVMGSQLTTSLGFLLLDAVPLTPQSITFPTMVAIVTLLSSLGVFALLFKIGLFVGTANQRLMTLESAKGAGEVELKALGVILGHHGESLAVMTNDLQALKQNMSVVRERQHDLANIMSAVTLAPVRLKPIGGNGGDKKEGV